MGFSLQELFGLVNVLTASWGFNIGIVADRGNMLDNVLLITIIFFIITTIVGTFISGRIRDRRLTSFRDFMVTLLKKDGKRVWGYLILETSGLDLLYSEDYLDEDHIETSYILFKEEYNNIYSLLRFHDELSEVNKHIGRH